MGGRAPKQELQRPGRRSQVTARPAGGRARARPSGDTSPGCPWVGLSRGGRCAPGAAQPHESEPEGSHHYLECYRDAATPTRAARPRRPRPGALCASQSDGTDGRPAPEAPPRAGALPANGRRSAGSQCAQPARSRLRARKANPTRRGRCSGPAAAAAAAAASSSPRIGLSQPESPVLRPGSEPGERAR